MKVWLVFCEDDDRTNMCGVFATEGLARAYIRKYFQNYNLSDPELDSAWWTSEERADKHVYIERWFVSDEE